MNSLALSLSKELDGPSSADLIRYESGFMTERSESIYDVLYRPFKANTHYVIIAYADARIEDFTLHLQKQKPDGQWETLKSVNENKRKKISNDPTNELGDYEILKDFTVASDSEYRLVLISDKKNSRSGRYSVLIYAKEGESTTTSSTNNTSSNSTSNVDFKQKIEATGLSYKVTEKGDYHLTVKRDDGRTQLIIITGKTQTYKDMELLDIWSPIKKITSKSDLGFANGLFLLERNENLKFGAWQIAGEKSPYLVNISITTSTSIASHDLKKIIEFLAEEADLREKELTQKDDY
ncbi:hypothetical protein P1X15_06610 [Runella sp. MFBS21]|uniref:hypothetical protein n=1 Tax=Runella sp. MFBS21 TaxID=3034018 RepID=UPI0023F8A9A9|nr:hypothetical protein [Runella sp. MFBS21]MDF7817259.1 hypothetical protein [Runella sp. MFBS21]